MDRSGIGRMMKSHAGIARVVHSSTQRVLAIAQSRAAVDTGELRESGRVEGGGVGPVFRGEPRMKFFVTFYARHAMAEEKRTGFLSGAIAQGRPR